jgi:hypothetical protein
MMLGRKVGVYWGILYLCTMYNVMPQGIMNQFWASQGTDIKISTWEGHEKAGEF